MIKPALVTALNKQIQHEQTSPNTTIFREGR